jgi:RNA polymerase sigma-70 factor (ECF subfamily)
MDPRTDADLIAASGADAGAFRELYDRYATAVGRFFLARTHDHHAALDLTSETFAELWRSRERFVDSCGGTIGPWLFAIARHTLARSARRHRIETSARDRLELRESALRRDVPAADEWLDGLDDAVAAAVAELPTAQRRAVELRVLDGCDYDDLAGALECSPTAARIRVSRGLAGLRMHLRPPTHGEELK